MRGCVSILVRLAIVAVFIREGAAKCSVISDGGSKPCCLKTRRSRNREMILTVRGHSPTGKF